MDLETYRNFSKSAFTRGTSQDLANMVKNNLDYAKAFHFLCIYPFDF
jgi:hypothetical protein